jgi:hypothetical protein
MAHSMLRRYDRVTDRLVNGDILIATIDIDRRRAQAPLLLAPDGCCSPCGCGTNHSYADLTRSWW